MNQTITTKMKRKSSETLESNSSKHARVQSTSSASSSTSTSTQICPYLDTVRRDHLDFDVPHICKTTLSDQNVYACLVCGQFFRGRSSKSPAFIHAVNESHFVYLKLDTGRAYCLPAGYEIQDSSLNDIKHELQPSFTTEMLHNMRQAHYIKKDIRGEDYLPGFIGLANLKQTDTVNAVVQILARVVPLQTFFLQDSNILSTCRSDLVRQFAELLRRIWNPHSFKRFISPYQFSDALSTASRGQFSVGKRAQCVQLLQWMLNHMHKYLKKASKSNTTVVTDAFQGHLQVCKHSSGGSGSSEGTNSEDITTTTSSSSSSSSSSSAVTEDAAVSTVSTTSTKVPFFKLSLDLPSKPLFRDESTKRSKDDEVDLLSTVSLFELLEKFDGHPITSNASEELSATASSSTSTASSSTSTSTTTSTTYGLTHLPKYLLLHVKRFSHNNYTVEKNNTIVSFPLRNLDMRPYMTKDALLNIPVATSLNTKSNSELKLIAKNIQCNITNIVERNELLKVVTEAVIGYTKYDLVANVGHKVADVDTGSNLVQQQNPHDAGMYHSQVYHRMGKQWYQIQDLDVQEVPNELITKSEVLMLLYERKNVVA